MPIITRELSLVRVRSSLTDLRELMDEFTKFPELSSSAEFLDRLARALARSTVVVLEAVVVAS